MHRSVLNNSIKGDGPQNSWGQSIVPSIFNLELINSINPFVLWGVVKDSSGDDVMFVMSRDVTNIPLLDEMEMKLPLKSMHSRVYCSKSKDFDSLYSYHLTHVPISMSEMYSVIRSNVESFYWSLNYSNLDSSAMMTSLDIERPIVLDSSVNPLFKGARVSQLHNSDLPFIGKVIYSYMDNLHKIVGKGFNPYIISDLGPLSIVRDTFIPWGMFKVSGTTFYSIGNQKRIIVVGGDSSLTSSSNMFLFLTTEVYVEVWGCESSSLYWFYLMKDPQGSYSVTCSMVEYLMDFGMSESHRELVEWVTTLQGVSVFYPLRGCFYKGVHLKSVHVIVNPDIPYTTSYSLGCERNLEEYPLMYTDRGPALTVVSKNAFQTTAELASPIFSPKSADLQSVLKGIRELPRADLSVMSKVTRFISSIKHRYYGFIWGGSIIANQNNGRQFSTSSYNCKKVRRRISAPVGIDESGINKYTTPIVASTPIHVDFDDVNRDSGVVAMKTALEESNMISGLKAGIWSLLFSISWEEPKKDFHGDLVLVNGNSVMVENFRNLSKAIKANSSIEVGLLANTLQNQLNILATSDSYAQTFNVARDLPLKLHMSKKLWLEQSDYEADSILVSKSLNEVLYEDLQLVTVKERTKFKSSMPSQQLLRQALADKFSIKDLSLVISRDGSNYYKHAVSSLLYKTTDLGNDLGSYSVEVVSVKGINSKIDDLKSKSEWVEWVEDGKIYRKYQNGDLYTIKDGRILSYSKVLQNKTSGLIQELSQRRNDKESTDFGVFDIECYVGADGVQVPYACGWTTSFTTKLYYIGDEFCDTPGNMLIQMVRDMMSMAPKYIFYAHNMGRYDGHLLVSYLDNTSEIDFTGQNLGSTTIMVIKLKNTLTLQIIQIRDSYLIITDTLAAIGETLGAGFEKLSFPYSFPTPDNLLYVGVNPIDSSDLNWSLRDSTLVYLERDLNILHTGLLKFSNNLWVEYSTDITKHYTIARIAIWIFYSKFYKRSNYPLANLSGHLAKEFRQNFFGGITRNYGNELNNGYVYDMVSQYPAAMLQDMPTGQGKKVLPVILDDFFGFVYCVVVAPTYSELRVPTLPYKSYDRSTGVRGKLQVGRGRWEGLYFSEEIKDAISRGYTVRCLYGYKFERGKDVFKSYVEHMFKLKYEAEDPVQRKISKLLLNYLYGKLGANEFDTVYSILNLTRLNHLEKEGYGVYELIPLTPNTAMVKISKKPLLSNLKLRKVVMLRNKELGWCSY